jgi:hypothetical protein
VCLGAYSGHRREISPLTPSGYRAFVVVTIHLSPLKRGSVQSKTRRATVQLDLLGYGESSNRHWVGSKVPIEASTHLYLFSSQRQAQASILLGVKGSRTSCMLMTGGAFQIFSFLRERESLPKLPLFKKACTRGNLEASPRTLLTVLRMKVEDYLLRLS